MNERYMINVDLEASNTYGASSRGCRSERHRRLGRHYDLTVHRVQCGRRGANAVQRKDRYWDDKQGQGYALDEVIEKVGKLSARHPNAHPRRCQSCDVKPHPPLWD